MVISQNGNAYSFGQSFNGQLGLGTKTMESDHPILLSGLSEMNYKFAHASCGENHTSLVTDNGILFTFGDGRHGKLCLDVETLTNHYTPALCGRFKDYEVLSAHCGGCHTMVVAKPRGASATITNGLMENGVEENGYLPDLSEKINLEARMRHRKTTDKKLPPIKSSKVEDPEDRVQEDEEKGDSDNEEEVKSEEEAPIQEEAADETSLVERPKTTRKISNFFRNLTIKKSTEAAASNGNIQVEDDESKEDDSDDEAADKNDEEPKKVESKEPAKKKVSFFNKIGFGKKTDINKDKPKESNVDVSAKVQDDGGTSPGNNVKEESIIDDDGPDSLSDDSGIKESQGTTPKRVEKHVRIKEETESINVTKETAGAAPVPGHKKSRMCTLL